MKLNLINLKLVRKFSALAIISTLCILFASCQKSNNGNIKAQEIDFKAYNNIGVVHNRTVDSMYNLLLVMKTNHQLNTSKSALASFVNTSIINGLKSKGEKLQTINSINTSMDWDLNVTKANHGIKVNSTTDLTTKSLYSDSLAAHLTIKQKQLLDKLLLVMTDESSSFESTLVQISDLEANAKANLSEDELPVIFVSTAIARNTLQYWHDNLDKWVALLDNGKQSTQGLKTHLAEASGPGFSWRNVGASDVAGGAGAAVTTWWLNTAVGYGQVAYGTAIGSAAAGASVGNAIYQLLSN
ncbi:hypothetical protein DYU05_18730 [Mucilaginibacter terrenus]|uniref:Lipoprotein n=1 Tax=Mucilaginibacter terrenus TaxID=2482727 RepID=A0A3E2NLI4_9SPHI|nr:hypothetical protein [Mucilaginibacter terrenus]RFZ81856.1 hypothetical protein DYU05_18730 [Mucilaginibacter terrenus]